MGYSLDTRRKIIDKIKECLSEHPDRNTIKPCNKKLLKGSKKQVYRLHISMTWTVFYVIVQEQNTVIITEIMGINQAHSKYGIV